MSCKDKTELWLKIILAVIAAFGVWKYFDQRSSDVIAASQSRSISYIERFAGDNMIDARTSLVDFWRDHEFFISTVRQQALTKREYTNFINVTYPAYAKRASIDKALFQIMVFYDEVAYCRRAGTCDSKILDEFFCDRVVRYVHVYAPFYDLMSAEIGSEGIDKNIRDLSAICQDEQVDK